ncbi:MAG TPA: hypothetical protein PK286_08675 [Devosia sp.]|nr:hypothetical protein [Devosia sp.]
MLRLLLSLMTVAFVLGTSVSVQAEGGFTDFKGNKAAVQGACPAGQFNENPTGYSCEKPNCNGKGGVCGVYCDNKDNCVGFTPGRIVFPGRQIKVVDLVGLFLNYQDKEPAPRGQGATGGSLSGGSSGEAGPKGPIFY